MLIRRATTLFHHNVRRQYATSAALIQEPPPFVPEFSYLEGFPTPESKYAEPIVAVPRSESGKSIAAKLRKVGRVPSIVFEAEKGELGGNKRLISVKHNQIKKLLDHFGRNFFLSRTFDLHVHPDLDSPDLIEKVRVLPQLLHLHPTKDAILNLTFIRAPSSALLKVDVPIVFRGNDVSPGLKKGSTLNIILRTVKFLCPADIIPPYIEVDLSEMDVGEKVLTQDLKVHPALMLLRDKDQAVVKISNAKSSFDPRTTV